ncbi:MAG: hypothetical protein VXY77_00090 [Pseudomonadota bacterium]|nr:hypothetical protein [Pseudomonadota bacterium]
MKISKIIKQSTPGRFQLTYTNPPDANEKKVSAKFDHIFGIEGRQVILIEIAQDHLQKKLMKGDATSLYMMFGKSSKDLTDCDLIGTNDKGERVHHNKYYEQSVEDETREKPTELDFEIDRIRGLAVDKAQQQKTKNGRTTAAANSAASSSAGTKKSSKRVSFFESPAIGIIESPKAPSDPAIGTIKSPKAPLDRTTGSIESPKDHHDYDFDARLQTWQQQWVSLARTNRDLVTIYPGNDLWQQESASPSVWKHKHMTLTNNPNGSVDINFGDSEDDQAEAGRQAARAWLYTNGWPDSVPDIKGPLAFQLAAIEEMNHIIQKSDLMACNPGWQAQTVSGNPTSPKPNEEELTKKIKDAMSILERHYQDLNYQPKQPPRPH